MSYTSATRFASLLICILLFGCGVDTLIPKVDSADVLTSEITVKTSGTLIDNGLNRLNLYLDSDAGALRLAPDAALELQVLQANGEYDTVSTTDFVTSSPFRFNPFDQTTPASYRVMFRRANGEEVELTRIAFNANLVLTSSITDQIISSVESIDFYWSWVNGDTPVNIATPELLLQYSLLCDGVYYNGNFDIPQLTGTSSNPFTLQVPVLLAAHPLIELPCDAEFNTARVDSRFMEPNSMFNAVIGDGLANSGEVTDYSDARFTMSPDPLNVTIE